MKKETVKLSDEYADRFRNQEDIQDLNGEWDVIEKTTENGKEMVTIKRGQQIRGSLPIRFIRFITGKS